MQTWPVAQLGSGSRPEPLVSEPRPLLPLALCGSASSSLLTFVPQAWRSRCVWVPSPDVAVVTSGCCPLTWPW